MIVYNEPKAYYVPRMGPFGYMARGWGNGTGNEFGEGNGFGGEAPYAFSLIDNNGTHTANGSANGEGTDWGTGSGWGHGCGSARSTDIHYNGGIISFGWGDGNSWKWK